MSDYIYHLLPEPCVMTRMTEIVEGYIQKHNLNLSTKTIDYRLALYIVKKAEAEEAEEKAEINLTFPDGSVRTFPAGVTGLDVAKSISDSLGKRAVAVSLNGSIYAATDVLKSGNIEIILRGDSREFRAGTTSRFRNPRPIEPRKLVRKTNAASSAS